MVKRVEKAKSLLLDPQNNVSQVAERCGFSEATYFARVFRMIAGYSPARVFRMIAGYSPSEYRENPLCDAMPAKVSAAGSADSVGA